MSDKDLMDTETRGEPATVQEGREPPAGSRGETGQKEGIDLTAAVGQESEGVQWECMSCGKVYDNDTKTCPDDGGSLRKVGPAARPVYAENMGPSQGLSPPETESSEDTPAGVKQMAGEEGSMGYNSATIEDLSARGEGATSPPIPEDEDEGKRMDTGGDHRLQAERVHKSDKGSPGGGGGVGAG